MQTTVINAESRQHCNGSYVATMLLYSLPPYLKGKALWVNLSLPIRVLLQSLKFKVTAPLVVYISFT